MEVNNDPAISMRTTHHALTYSQTQVNQVKFCFITVAWKRGGGGCYISGCGVTLSEGSRGAVV